MNKYLLIFYLVQKHQRDYDINHPNPSFQGALLLEGGQAQESRAMVQSKRMDETMYFECLKEEGVQRGSVDFEMTLTTEV